jgi:glycosyltransferase involved in cell wall biosynthesis
MTHVIDDTRISVVIPCRDRQDLLIECLENLSQQTLLPFEVVVVDDASYYPLRDVIPTDNLPFELTFVRSEASKGANAARNLGVRAARGGIVAFQDSDDLWLPTKLELEFDLWRRSSTEVPVLVYAAVKRVYSGGEMVFPRTSVLADDVGVKLLRGNFISTQTVLASKSTFLQFPFDETLPRLQDWELWLRMSPVVRFVGISEVLAVSRETDLSISTSQESYWPALETILSRHGRTLWRQDRAGLAHFQRALAVHWIRSKRYGKAVRSGVQALTADLRADRNILAGRLPRIRENMEI